MALAVFFSVFLVGFQINMPMSIFWQHILIEFLVGSTIRFSMATSGVHLSACPCRCFLFGRFRSSFPCLSSSSHSSSLLLLLLNSSRAGFGSRERERDFHGGWVTRESRPLETLGRKLRPSHISGVHHVVLRFPIHSTPFFLTCSKVFVVRPRRQQHRQEIFQNRNLQRLASTLVWFDQSGPNYFPSSSPPVSQNHAMNPHVPKKELRGQTRKSVPFTFDVSRPNWYPLRPNMASVLGPLKFYCQNMSQILRNLTQSTRVWSKSSQNMHPSRSKITFYLSKVK